MTCHIPEDLNVHLYCSENLRSLMTNMDTNCLVMLYAFFRVIPCRLKFVCRRFRTLCLFRLHRQVRYEFFIPIRLQHSGHGKSFKSRMSCSAIISHFIPHTPKQHNRHGTDVGSLWPFKETLQGKNVCSNYLKTAMAQLSITNDQNTFLLGHKETGTMVLMETMLNPFPANVEIW